MHDFKLKKERVIVRNYLERVLKRFSTIFDARLLEGLKKINANCAEGFIEQRDSFHIKKILIFQFFIQKRIEQSIATSPSRIFSKFFFYKKQFCLIAGICFSETAQLIDKERLIKALQMLVPGSDEVPGSFWRWLHPELPYMCFYIEMHKLRGQDFSSRELLHLKLPFEERLALQVRTPSIFWPLNEEESYKQLRVLKNELQLPTDLPQVTIHFRQQTDQILEFLVNVARPNHLFPLEQKIGILPPSTSFFLHFSQKIVTPFPQETLCFSLFLTLQQFNEHQTINLLQARNRVVHYLQQMLGPFRDYNGGMLETQRGTFTSIFGALADKIAYFTQFADKAFHALQPVEARITLSLDDLTKILQAISNLICQTHTSSYISEEGTIWVFRSQQLSQLQFLAKQAKQKKLIYTQFVYEAFHYFCVFDKSQIHIEAFKKEAIQVQQGSVLKLVFFEGAPPSLSPSLSGGDMRCLVLSKLLFEGLMRIDAAKIPQPAAANRILISPCKKKYTLTLRHSYWSNGQLVTAFDFLNSWKKILNRQWTCNRPYLLFSIKNSKKCYYGLCTDDEVGIKALDSKTLHIELEYHDPYFLEKLAQPVFFPSFGNEQEPTVFNGPFLVHEHNQKKLDLEINPYFWDFQRVYFQSVNISWNLTAEEAASQFMKKEIDWLGDPFTPLSASMLKEIEKKGLLHQEPVSRFFLLYLNTQHPLLCSSLIRQALSLSLDRAFICKNIFPHYCPLYTPIPFIQEPLLKENSILAQEYFEQGLQNLNFSKKTLPEIVLHCVARPDHSMLARYVQKAWQKELGLRVQIKELPWNPFYSLLEKKHFQMAGCLVNAFSQDQGEFLQRFEDQDSLFNFSQWEDMRYKSFVQSIATAEGKEKERLVREAATVMAHNAPYIPICTQTLLYAKNPSLRGELFDIGGCVDFRFSFLEETT